MKTEKFNYDLPEHLIAQYPSIQRADSKLLVALESIQHQVFKDIENYLDKGDLLILNKTSVIPARLFGEKTTGGKIELLLERFLSNHQTLTQIRSSRTPKEGAELVFSFQGQRFLATVEGRQDNFFILNWSDDPKYLFEQYGQIPLPPYMNRDARSDDIERYQTVYAHTNGSVAAPTAGLHFTQRIFQSLERTGHDKVELTLHVGAGTFKPLGEGEIEAHQMHDEEIILSQKWLKQYLGHEGVKIAVGTTSLRSLESFHWIGAKLIETGELSPLGQFEAYTLNSSLTVTQTYSALLEALKIRGIMELALYTQLMIKPGYSFKTVKGIVTNFHQPGSTLLLLVGAAVGEQWREIYSHALENDYRFLSYGDSSFLLFQGN